MIDKMSVGASRLGGRITDGPLIEGRQAGAGHINAIRSPDQAGKIDGPNSSLSGAIDHMVQQGMPIDMQRITTISQAIADGKYPVDPVAIADRMIEFDRPGSGF